MCDYSLEHMASRPARVADRLVSTSFLGTMTRGFTAPGEPHTAVCLMPGTEIAFDAPPRYQSGVFFGRKTAPGTVARFRSVNRGVPHTHRDALEFPDGTIVMLASLLPDQRATVLQLPAAPQEHPRHGALAEIPTSATPEDAGVPAAGKLERTPG